MNYQTEMMREILTNRKAQEIIDYVSQIYGSSYVGLWIFEAIGTVLDEAFTLSEDLMADTNPATSTLLLAYWEKAYGITPDPSLTVEQRRARIVAKMRTTGACTPAKLEAAISGALGGITVNVIERTGKNKFTVSITGAAVVAPAIEVIERLKPAHLIYDIQGATDIDATAETYVALAVTHAEIYHVVVKQEMPAVDELMLIYGELLILKPDGTTEQTESTSDAQGNVTITTPGIRSYYDGSGNLTLSL